jgi:hypothetical protein
MTSQKVLDNRRRVNDWQKRNPEKYSFQLWRSSIRRKYNLTVEQYDEMFQKQNGLCAICFQPEKSLYNGKPYRLAVDHCHTTLKVRGLLCRDCNQILGKFDEDIQRFQSAIDYIKTHKKDGN